MSRLESMSLDEEQSQEMETEQKEIREQSPEGYKEFFDAFKQDLETLNSPEEKLEKTITFMEASLSEGKVPHFKNFWEARTICLELFKENLNPPARSHLWAKYSELSKEARRLKSILDEQSAFAAEQIDIAITALEHSLESADTEIEKAPLNDFPHPLNSLIGKLDEYKQMQRQLNLLNTQATRINTLRKELIRTEMRVRQKNKFFQRLSHAGDKVFPKRKELIKEISYNFEQDVDAFIEENISGELGDSIHSLREEIKALQGVAKILTLNTHSFTHTRLKLSGCWDKIKEVEKEKKKHWAQKKSIFKENAEKIQEQISTLSNRFSEGQLSPQEALKVIEEIAGSMRSVELGREEVKTLREEFVNARKPVSDALKALEEERHRLENEKELARKEKVDALKQEIDDLLRRVDIMEADDLASKREEIQEKIASTAAMKSEKLELEKPLKFLKDLIAEKKEKALMSLPDKDREALSQLKELLVEKKQRRTEIKNAIEQLRRSAGGSGLDFAQSMNINNLMAEEKETLDKINHGIREIEKKISDIEKNI